MTTMVVRPVNVRLAVAQLYTSTLECAPQPLDPGCSIVRAYRELCQSDSDPKRYARMWDEIWEFHDQHLSECTDDEILDHRRIALRLNNTIGPFTITPDRMRNAVSVWHNYGWYRYEIKRANKIRTTQNYSMRGAILALALFGFDVGSNS